MFRLRFIINSFEFALVFWVVAVSLAMKMPGYMGDHGFGFWWWFWSVPNFMAGWNAGGHIGEFMIARRRISREREYQEFLRQIGYRG